MSKGKDVSKRVRTRGEFDPCPKQSLSRDDKRDLFLFEIHQFVPDVLNTLHNDVFLKFRSYIYYLFDVGKLGLILEKKTFDNAFPGSSLVGDARATAAAQYYWAQGRIEHLHYWHHLEVADEYYPELCLIREAVSEWSIQWHLDADWYRERALQQLLYWEGYGVDEPISWELGGYGYRSLINHKQEIAFLPAKKFPGWFPFLKTEEKYLDDLRQQLWATVSNHPVWVMANNQPLKSDLQIIIEKLLKSIRQGYCRNLITFYKAKGYKRANQERKLTTHIRWTVQSLFVPSTAEEIADAENAKTLEKLITPDQVRKAVQRMLQILGLSRKGGHPPGRKNSSQVSHRKTL